MRQRTIHIIEYSPEKAAQALSEVTASPEYREAGQVLLLMLEQNWDEARIREKVALARSLLPRAEIAGITHFDGFGEAEPPENTLFTLLFFDRPAFALRRVDLSGRDEASAGRELNEWLRGQRFLRGAMTLFSKFKRDVGAVLDAAGQGLGETPFFGADAAVDAFFEGKNGAGWVFDGDGCYRDAVLAVAFFGESLSIRAACNFGWIPVGKTMTVTGAKGGYTVTEIDGRPAAEVFERYLGLPYRTSAFSVENISEFPLTVEGGGLLMARIPYAWTAEGALEFDITMRVGDRVRLSYGLPQQVFSQVFDDADAFRAFEPQAMLMVVCMNRMLFLKERERMETDAYRSVAHQAAFLHGNSEIYRLGGAGGEMHSALVTVGFREGPATGAPAAGPVACPYSAKEGVIPLENRVLTFMRAVTSDLERTTEELLRLEKNLENEVEIKTRENESLSLHVVQTLAEAIDAKDTYTHGHSGRVAAYSREIARRAGYSERAQNEIFMMGLLHDVGKIGVPDAVINKPGRLTDDEFAQIKRHPGMGARILGAIREMPKLATGARWHHERFDGRGYPDGLAGTDIPEEARIIGVADAYDAMTSNRSYRRSMEQSLVREQIEKGRGAQFDPRFADIMLQMIDDDRDYRMREK